MQCPIDQTELRLAERQGVEIDYCPQCRGVWLDRGELDKILEREAAHLATGRAPHGDLASLLRDRIAGRGDRGRDDEYRDHERYDDDDHEWDEHGRRRRRGGWLGDLLDF